MVTENTITSILNRFRSLRILVIGDLMLDHYIWGEVHRISPEAPVPIVHVTRETWRAGGAANVALNVAGLGAQTHILGHIGGDSDGDRLRRLLSDEGIQYGEYPRPNGHPTIVKTRVIAQHQQLCRIDRENHLVSDEANTDWGNSTLLEAVQNADAVILSDYAKGVIQQSVLDQVNRTAALKGKLVAVDPKPSHGLSLQGVGLLTPNRHEALQLAGIPEPVRGAPYPLDEIAATIHQRWSIPLLIITLGAEGMAICREGRVEHQLPTVARQVFDVSGAGDTVVATLTLALASGMTPLDAARLANAAAGYVVSQVGTVHITTTELLANYGT